MNAAEHFAGQTKTVSKFPLGKNGADQPIWLLGTPDDIGRKGDLAFEELIVGWGLMQMYGRQVPFRHDAIAAIPSRTLPERLASLLLDLSAGKNGVIKDVAFGDLAIALDTHRETVASVLRAFRRQGMVNFGHRRILIQDIESLYEIGGDIDFRPDY